MPYYIQREEGTIVGLYLQPQNFAQEVLADDHPDVLAFKGGLQRLAKPIISDRQFFQALAMQGKITEQEAEDAVATGSIPPAMQAIVDGISDHNQNFAAKMLLKGATEFSRTHPLVAMFAAAQSPPMTEADVDVLWDYAATL
jgi:hypothetical protein